MFISKKEAEPDAGRKWLEEKFAYREGAEYQSLANFILRGRLNSRKVSQRIDSEAEGILALLADSPIPDGDKGYVEAIIRQDPRNSKLLSSVGFLLEAANSPLARRKTEERNNQAQIELDSILAPFSTNERIILAQNLFGVQLTEGCTVGCSFCGLKALRQTNFAFSFRSLGKFSLEYKPFLKREMSLYLASDPFDWKDGDYSYTDVESLWDVQTTVPPFTSTAIPLATEFTVLRFLEYLYQVDLLARNVKLGGWVADDFRFSITEGNQERAEHILEILRQRKVDKSFLEAVQTNDLTKKDKIVRQGYWIKYPDRDIVNDSVGISCMDGVVFTPAGIKAMVSEICTIANPKGLAEWDIKPGYMRVPRFIHIDDGYSYHGFKTQEQLTEVLQADVPEIFALLPKAKIIEARDGIITGEKEIDSLRREALTFGLAAINVAHINNSLAKAWKWFRRHPKSLEAISCQLRELERQLSIRINDSRELSSDASDPEAITVAEKLAQMANKNFSTTLSAIEELSD